MRPIFGTFCANIIYERIFFVAILLNREMREYTVLRIGYDDTFLGQIDHTEHFQIKRLFFFFLSELELYIKCNNKSGEKMFRIFF